MTEAIRRCETFENRLDHRVVWIAFAVIAAVSVYSLVFFLSERLYLVGSDIFYYMSISDGILENGTAMVHTFDPPIPLKTPQNGVVVLHMALTKLGVSPESRLILLTLLNYALHLTALYPLYHIARRLGVQGWLPIAALIASYFAAFHVVRFQLMPMNDGIFNAMSLWLAYLFLVVLQDHGTGEPQPRQWVTPHVAAIVALSLVIVQFRLNGVLIAMAVLAAAVLTRRLYMAALAVFSLAASFVSLAVVYAVVDTSRIREQSDAVVGGLFGWLVPNVVDMATTTLPELFLVNLGRWGKLVGPVFVLALVVAASYTAYTSLTRRQADRLFIPLYGAAAVGFVIVLQSQLIRLMVYIVPVLVLLLLFHAYSRPVAYALVGLMVLSSIVVFYRGFDRGPESHFWLYLIDNDVRIPQETPLLLSGHARHTYYILDAPSYRGELNIRMILDRGGVYLVGDDEYVSGKLAEVTELADQAGYAFDTESLTPGYSDSEGHSLLQLSEFRALAMRPSSSRLVTAP